MAFKNTPISRTISPKYIVDRAAALAVLGVAATFFYGCVVTATDDRDQPRYASPPPYQPQPYPAQPYQPYPAQPGQPQPYQPPIYGSPQGTVDSDLNAQVAALDDSAGPGPQDPQAPQYAPDPNAPQPDLQPPVATVDVNVFAQDLQPMGDWVVVADYHHVWRPRGTPVGWRPYTVGHWVYTDYGATWASDESWGEITYHYGSWVEDARYGWVWVPGRVWAPAWVAWRTGDANIGWAPLPPKYCTARRPVGEVEVQAIPATMFIFVPAAQVLAPHQERVVMPRTQNVTIIKQTVNVTNITVTNHVIVNNSLPIQKVEAVTHTKVVPIVPKKVSDPKEAAKLHAQGQPVIYAPPPAPVVVKPATPPVVRPGTPPVHTPPPPPQPIVDPKIKQQQEAAELAKQKQAELLKQQQAAEQAKIDAANRATLDAAKQEAASLEAAAKFQAEVKQKEAELEKKRAEAEARQQELKRQADLAKQQKDAADRAKQPPATRPGNQTQPAH